MDWICFACGFPGCLYGAGVTFGVGQHNAFMPVTQHFPSPQASLHIIVNPDGQLLLEEHIGDVPFQ